MYIAPDDATSLAQYDTFAASSPFATLFQTRAWAHVKNNWDAHYFIHKTDGEIDAAMQVLSINDADIGGRLFYACRGPICDPGNAELVAALVNEAADFARENGGFLFRADPAAELDEQLEARYLAVGLTVTRDPFSSSQPLMNAVLKIRGRNSEQLLTDYSRNTRKQILKAGRLGVSTHLGTAGDLELFYKIICKSNEYHGITTRPLSYFQRIFEAFPCATRLSFSVYDGRPIATSLMVIHGKTAYGLYGGDTREVHLSQSYQLDFAEICHAIDAGCEAYDMGGILSDDDDDPLTHFKKKFTAGNIVYWLGNIDVPLDEEKYAAYTARASIGASRER